MMRRFYIYAIMLLAVASCSQKMSGPELYGSLDLRLSSEVEAEVSTKAEEASTFALYNIRLTGTKTGNDPYTASVVYGEIEEPLVLPYGLYSIEAESCTETQAHEGYGCVRFYGKTDGIQIKTPAENPTPVSVECHMANSKISVSFDPGFLSDFEQVRAELVMGERIITITSDQAASVMAYFNVGQTGSEIIYSVYGTIDDVERQYSSSILLLPAKHASLTFKSNHNGILGPQVTVDGEMGTNEIEGSVIPGSGTPVTGGDIEKPVIYVEYAIKDAVEIETIIDVIDKEDMTL